MALKFVKAKKTSARLRLALVGPSGSGKTYTALVLASFLESAARAAGRTGRVAVIDSERGSASKYADTFDFDKLELEDHAPETYMEAIQTAEKAGYEVVVIDSLSHAWMGKDGALERIDNAAKRNGGGNSFAAWRDVTPLHNKLIDTMTGATCHLLVTMRSKTEWVMEDVKGKKVPRRVGLAPVQRDGMEYEFDVVAEMDLDHNFIPSKTRCSGLAGKVFMNPGEDVADILLNWLDGEPAPTVEDMEAMVDACTSHSELDALAVTLKMPPIVRDMFDARREVVFAAEVAEMTKHLVACTAEDELRAQSPALKALLARLHKTGRAFDVAELTRISKERFAALSKKPDESGKPAIPAVGGAV